MAIAENSGNAGDYNINQQMVCNVIPILSGTTGKVLITFVITALCMAPFFRHVSWRKAFILIAVGVVFIVCDVSLLYIMKSVESLALIVVMTVISAVSFIGIAALTFRKISWGTVIIMVLTMIFAMAGASVYLENNKGQCTYSWLITS